MAKKDDDFLRKLLATFKVESEEHIQVLTSGLLELEKNPAPQKVVEIVESLFREAHSLKGAARTVNVKEIEAICQSLENVFAVLKRKEVQLSPTVFDTLHESIDLLHELVPGAGGREMPVEQSRIADCLEALEKISRGLSLSREEQGVVEKPAVLEAPRSEVPATPGRETPAAPETLRIAAAKLDALLLQAEELLSVKLSTRQRAGELRDIAGAIAQWKREWGKLHVEIGTIRRALEKKNNGQAKANGHLLKLLEFLERSGNFIQSIEDNVSSVHRRAEEDHRTLGAAVDHLLEDMKKVVMLPFSSILTIFPKFVRDLSREQGKEVELIIRGAEIGIDKRILEEMKDPLTHLLRNCIDHGIEKVEDRLSKKKPRRGTITIQISQKEGSKAEILISDDGAGIDPAKVLAGAVKLGILTHEEAQQLSYQEACALIFRSGVSTSPMITDISGRGLGLAIVQEKVHRLGGTIMLETERNLGTTFRIVLPLTLASFRGILVRAHESIYVLPVSSVERVVRVNKADIKTVENKETIRVNGEPIAVVSLGAVLGLPVRAHPPNRSGANAEAAEHVQAVLVAAAQKRIAFLVDEVLGEQEVLVKSLGKQLARVPNVAGATVLGTGKVVPILNVADLVRSAVHISAIPAQPGPPAVKGGEVERKSILVVEDSITARTLLKNVLEAAGYDIATAIDGVDAFTQLRTGTFDLVVSDVDMPRMNGFDLTAKIRSDKKLADLPVVLVTALESREDRERGVDVGANAYIVKSSFDQSNLLEVIRRLV